MKPLMDRRRRLPDLLPRTYRPHARVEAETQAVELTLAKHPGGLPVATVLQILGRRSLTGGTEYLERLGFRVERRGAGRVSWILPSRCS